MVALSKEDPNKPLSYFSQSGHMDAASTIAARDNGKEYMIGDGNGQGNLNGFSFMEGDRSGPLLFKAMIELATQTKHLTLDKFHRFEGNKLEPKVAGDLNENQALSEISKLDNKVEALIAGMMDRK